MTTSLKKYLLVCLKGIGMGAADVIPGVSGGTIAFMTGIYEELVGSINNINGAAVKLLFKGRFREFWKHINGTFLVSLIAGILISIMSLAKLMTYLLSHLPVPTWAFFFGLIIASSVFILKDIKGWKLKDGVMLVLGVVLGVVVCTLSPTETPDALWFIFLSGAIAICAMILPGISGSFILLILGNQDSFGRRRAAGFRGGGDLRAGCPGRHSGVLEVPALAAGALPQVHPAGSGRLHNRLAGEGVALERHGRGARGPAAAHRLPGRD